MSKSTRPPRGPGNGRPPRARARNAGKRIPRTPDERRAIERLSELSAARIRQPADPIETAPVETPLDPVAVMLRAVTGKDVGFQIVAEVEPAAAWRVVWARWTVVDHDWIGKVGAKPGARPVLRRPPPLRQSEDFADEAAARHLADWLRERDGDEIAVCVVPISATAPPKAEQPLLGDWPIEKRTRKDWFR